MHLSIFTCVICPNLSWLWSVALVACHPSIHFLLLIWGKVVQMSLSVSMFSSSSWGIPRHSHVSGCVSSSKGEPSPPMDAFWALFICNIILLIIAKAHDRRRGLECWLTVKSKALPSGSAPSSPQRSSTTATLLLMLHQSACRSPTPFYPHSWTRAQEIVHLGQPTPSPEGAIHFFQAENHGLGGADSHPDSFAFDCKLIQCVLKFMI